MSLHLCIPARTTRRQSLRIALALAAAWAGWPAAPATAQPTSTPTVWLSTSSGSWNIPTNWSNGIPGQNSDVRFSDPTATVMSTTNDVPSPSPLVINSLSVLSNVTGLISIGGGSPLSVQNGVNVASGQSLTISAGLGVNGNPSNLTMNGPGLLTLTGPSFINGNGQVNGGTVLVNTTLLGSMAVNSASAAIGGNGAINGGLVVNANGTVSAGTGVGASTLSVNGLSLNGSYNVTLFGTGYTSSGSADISRIAIAGSNNGNFNNSTVNLDLSQLSSGRVSALRSVSAPSRDYLSVR